MIYLDYSATTPVDDLVLESFVSVNKKYIGNPNSLHKLGSDASRLIDAATKQITDILKLKGSEIIYTSGASEANNTAIKGICLKYQNRGKHIITTKLEHSSIIEVINYLSTLGFSVDYVNLDSNGLVDLDDLKRLIRSDTLLVTIASVNSEVGVRQDLKAISKLLKENKKTFFHSDITQSIGKEYLDLDCIDLASLSAQKFYGLKGSGLLIKKESIVIEPLIHGGKSTTIYRSGTPSCALSVSLAKALRLMYQDLDIKLQRVEELSIYLKEEISKNKLIHINCNSKCVNHIVNISIPGIKSEVMLHALEVDEVYISTKTACSSDKDLSEAVYAVTNNLEYAKSSLRISISHLTTKEEIDILINSLNKNIDKLNLG